MPNPITHAFFAAVSIGIGLLFAFLAIASGSYAARKWGESDDARSVALLALVFTIGSFASFAAARHHWRADKPRS